MFFAMNNRIFRILVAFLFLTVSIFGQTVDKDKTETAVQRSKKAAEIIKTITALPEGQGIPKTILDKSQMIGVVPDAFRLSLLIGSAVRGHGVISSRDANGWSLPLHYFFGGDGGGFGKIGTKNFDIILLFINPKSKDLFIKKGSKIPKVMAAKGPMDISTPEVIKALEKADLLFYTFSEGKILGKNPVVSMSVMLFTDLPSIVFDDKLNKYLYGEKTRDIFLGKTITLNSAASEASAFRDTLNEKLPVSSQVKANVIK